MGAGRYRYAAVVLTAAMAVPKPGSATPPPDRLAHTGANPRTRFHSMASADMKVLVTAGAIVVGLNATYSVAVSNLGPNAAAGPITVLDTIPVGLAITSASGTGWICAVTGQVATCTKAGSVSSGASLPVLLIVATVSISTPPSVLNIARVSSPTADPNPANNRATLTSTVVTAGVAVTPDAAAIDRLPSNGTTYSQLFTIVNVGTATDVFSVVATAIPGTVLAIVSVNGVPGSTASVSVASAGNVVIDVRYTIPTAAVTGATGLLTLMARSSTNPAVKDPGDLTVRVIRAGLVVSKQLYRDNQATVLTPADVVQPGEFVQYKVSVTNSGVGGAVTVHLSDPLPARTTYSTAAADLAGWTIANAAGTVTADLAGTLAAGTSRYFWIRVQIK